MQVNFGISWNGFWRRATLTNNQLSLIDANGFIGQNMPESHCPFYRYGNLLCQIALVEFGDQQCPFRRDAWYGLLALVSEFCYSFVHGFLFLSPASPGLNPGETDGSLHQFPRP